MMSAIPLEDTRLLRLPEVLALVPVGKSTWWQGIKDGRFPKPVKIGPRISAWHGKEIRDLISRLSVEA